MMLMIAIQLREFATVDNAVNYTPKFTISREAITELLSGPRRI